MHRAQANPEDAPEFPVPTIDEFPCPNCGMRLEIADDPKGEKYTRQAEEYVEAFEDEFERTIDDLQEMFPDVPIKEYLDQKCENVRRAITLLKKSFDKGLEFEERCELENIMEEFE